MLCHSILSNFLKMCVIASAWRISDPHLTTRDLAAKGVETTRDNILLKLETFFKAFFVSLTIVVCISCRVS